MSSWNWPKLETGALHRLSASAPGIFSPILDMQSARSLAWRQRLKCRGKREEMLLRRTTVGVGRDSLGTYNSKANSNQRAKDLFA